MWELHVLIARTALAARNQRTVPPPLGVRSTEQKHSDTCTEQINTTGLQSLRVPCGLHRKTWHILVATLLWSKAPFKLSVCCSQPGRARLSHVSFSLSSVRMTRLLSYRSWGSLLEVAVFDACLMSLRLCRRWWLHVNGVATAVLSMTALSHQKDFLLIGTETMRAQLKHDLVSSETDCRKERKNCWQLLCSIA